MSNGYDEDQDGPAYGNVGEYYDQGSNAAPAQAQAAQPVVGVPFAVRGPFRLGALETVAQNASAPLPRIAGSAAMMIGGLLMAASEFWPGAKGHHTAIGKWGRIVAGAGLTYWGFLYAAEAVEQYRMSKGG